ncbi:hypothetical protein CSV77_03630 [Sporosarcina sp. P16b]|uniref:sigma factor-like helix-turn-helix DNA-binding protein n=1 Tax=Sporosarcina sp. P16b TaxID=2048261 RepID=UPI000C1710F7|nr:sigma factor-like helix-turn-helix DNA-binding protein [Sporosarcina sp. P16b]PIC71142.1 hypothetical protein CSV77_03630 [Sporosarcina sp. P16b]
MQMTYKMVSPEMHQDMIKVAYQIMDYIERLEGIEKDETSSQERRQAAAREKSFQQADLEKLKSMMKNSRIGFTRVIYLKYIEGYTLQEVADELNLSRSALSVAHANFKRCLKNPVKKERKEIDIDQVTRNIQTLQRDNHELECKNCGSINRIPRHIINKIIKMESVIKKEEERIDVNC